MSQLIVDQICELRQEVEEYIGMTDAIQIWQVRERVAAEAGIQS